VIDLIGRRYELGADGSGPEGKIDCIHLVYIVRQRLGLPCPTFRSDWYRCNRFTVYRDLLRWGSRISGPAYDGDVALVAEQSWVFAVVWDQGLLIISGISSKVRWFPFTGVRSCQLFRHRE
jgi:hypothetical protein